MSSSKSKGSRKVASQLIIKLIRGVNAGADAFGPLKSATGAVLFIVDAVDVCPPPPPSFQSRVTHLKRYYRNSSQIRKNGKAWVSTHKTGSLASFDELEIPKLFERMYKLQ
jgi:hypothetical protein